VLAPGRTRFTLRSAVPMRVLRFGARAGKRALKIVFERGEPLAAGKEFVLAVENPDGEPLECTLSGRFHDAPSLAEGRKRYRGEIEAVDRAVGLLVERLRARGAYDNTLIVVTSDHGLALGEHGNLGRGELLFDEFLHVPLLIKPVKGDERVEQLAQSAADVTRLLDVVPTLLELADVRAMPGAGGGSLLEHRRRELIAETRTAGAACSTFAIRDERFKLVLGGDNYFEMYDLCADTLEQENVFSLQGQHKLEWQRRLGALVSSSQAPQGADPGARLEALGY
jgi:arylsulfatase A-like enzyme